MLEDKVKEIFADMVVLKDLSGANTSLISVCRLICGIGW